MLNDSNFGISNWTHDVRQAPTHADAMARMRTYRVHAYNQAIDDVLAVLDEAGIDDGVLVQVRNLLEGNDGK